MAIARPTRRFASASESLPQGAPNGGPSGGSAAIRPDGRPDAPPDTRMDTIKIFLGHQAVSDRRDVMMATTLGSCVAACIHDPVAGVGGMNHFMLPDLPASELEGDGRAARYGSVAMERLINALLHAGAQRRRMQVKLFGGGHVIESSYDIGGLNSRFALDYVRREGLTLVAHDLGGDSARRVHYFPQDGRALRRLLRPEAASDAVQQERHFMSRLRQIPVEGAVELFTDPSHPHSLSRSPKAAASQGGT